MATSNSVVIPVELDTKRFDRKIQALESKVSQITKDIEADTNEKKMYEDAFENAISKTDELTQNIARAKQEIANFQKELDLTTYDSSWRKSLETAIDISQKSMKPTLEALNRESIKQEEIALKIQKQENKIQKKRNALEGVLKQLDYEKQKRIEIEQEEQKNTINLSGISNATEGIIKKVIRWGLALFSIRSVYSFIRGSISTLSQSNEQIASDIEYIRWALATTLQPIIEFIIKLAYTLLQAINSIVYSLFGVNLFANATADAFKRSKDNLKGTNKQAKELQKTLAGFDEMNILQKDGSVSGGGGGGGVALPTTNLANVIEGFSLSGVFDTLKLWWQGIVDFFEHGITDFFGSFEGRWATLMDGVGMIIQGFYFQWKGIFEGIIGVVEVVIGILSGDWELIEQGFNNLLSGIINLIRGTLENVMGMLVGMIGLWKGLFSAMFDFVGGLIGSFINSIKNFFGIANDEISTETWVMIDNEEATRNLEQAKKDLADAMSGYTNAFEKSAKADEALAKAEKDTGESGKELYDRVLANREVYKTLSPEQRNVLDLYLKSQSAEKDLTKATDEMNKAKENEYSAIEQVNRGLAQQGKSYDENLARLIEMYRNGEMEAEDFAQIIYKIMLFIDNQSRATFAQNLPEDIKQSLASMEYFKKGAGLAAEGLTKDFTGFFTSTQETMNKVRNVVGNTFTQSIPNDMSKTNDAIDKTTKKFSGLTSAIKNVGNINIKFSSGGVGVAKGGIVTRLATGGIVNQPSRGVPLANAITGEAGREGIIPLTDSQAMETLGQAIGKYISLNATIPVYVGNRQVAKELKRIETEDGFAFNG